MIAMDVSEKEVRDALEKLRILSEELKETEEESTRIMNSVIRNHNLQMSTIKCLRDDCHKLQKHWNTELSQKDSVMRTDVESTSITLSASSETTEEVAGSSRQREKENLDGLEPEALTFHCTLNCLKKDGEVERPCDQVFTLLEEYISHRKNSRESGVHNYKKRIDGKVVGVKHKAELLNEGGVPEKVLLYEFMCGGFSFRKLPCLFGSNVREVVENHMTENVHSDDLRTSGDYCVACKQVLNDEDDVQKHLQENRDCDARERRCSVMDVVDISYLDD